MKQQRSVQPCSFATGGFVSWIRQKPRITAIGKQGQSRRTDTTPWPYVSPSACSRMARSAPIGRVRSGTPHPIVCGEQEPILCIC